MSLGHTLTESFYYIYIYIYAIRRWKNSKFCSFIVFSLHQSKYITSSVNITKLV